MNSLAKKYYPLADAPNERELRDLQVEDRVGIRAVPTGEMRPPKAGEWFLSGAIVEGYRASNDISAPYHIAKLVVL